MEDYPVVADQTLSFDDIEAEHGYHNCHFTPANETIRLMDVTLDHCEFDQTNFNQGEFVRVTLTHCQLVNTSWLTSRWYDCELRNLQLSGADFTGSFWQRTTIATSKLAYANFSESQLNGVSLQDCDLLESAFQAVRSKGGVDFAGSRLTGASFIETRLKGFDWHAADFEAVSLSADLAKGLTINQFQAAQLIGLLGIKISE
ncbi:pentapeptide repeat-containing protein [Levilactobacillus senmaizukei DSM 21775 = NBRC 103853]|uniref:Pentapeptide repeat-containing protein n=1 Tax=Levilactobacillus senmaizukei DSM 21775 = NBRC 103853 TaxID=1423803 RepID=A0A0R2DC32_9LACO|nr:pentapeptide repeat-containing protein [Levilactobacillus senmaizukei]KRN01406.1 pentapeptide repeat-containing protein [Levilactobacillus senmaizukei DSM 21775 = NBRC 103853]